MNADAVSVASAAPTASSSTYSGSGITARRDHTKLGVLSIENESSRSKWNLGLVAVGSLKTQEVLGSFYARLTSSEKRQLATLLSPVIRSAPPTLSASTRRRIDPEKEGGVLFVAVGSTGGFLLCAYFRDSRYPERLAFALLGEVEQLVQEAVAEVPSCSVKGGALEKRLREPVRRLMTKYDNAAGLDKTAEVLKKADDVKIQVRDNLQKVLRNQEGLADLTAKSEGLSTSARTFHKTTEDASSAIFWSDIRTIIVSAILLLLSTALCVYVVVSIVGGKSSG